MKKVEIRDSIFEQMRDIRKDGKWSELCENDVFFSELVEMLLMQLLVEQRLHNRMATIKKEFEDKFREYEKGDIPEWRMKNEKKQ